MSIKKSQQFYYFQNKANHYNNVRSIKSTIDNKLSSSLRHTIDHTKSPRKIIPHLKQYQMQQQNQRLMKRLFVIMNGKKSQISNEGNYSRFHNSQRPFRRYNPHKQQQQRMINQENQKIFSKLNKSKPLVGSNDQWKQQFDHYTLHKRNLSKFNDDKQLKDPIQISTDRYIPNNYRLYFETDLDNSTVSKKQVKLDTNKIFQLPMIYGSSLKHHNPQDPIAQKQKK